MTPEEIARMVQAACAAYDAAVITAATTQVAEDAGIDTSEPEWWNKI